MSCPSASTVPDDGVTMPQTTLMSVVEDTVAVFMSLSAVLAPFLVIFFLIMIVVLFFWARRRRKRRKAAKLAAARGY